MSEVVSTLADVSLRQSRYIFLLLNERPFNSEVQKALNSSAKAFGDRIGLGGRVVQATAKSDKQLVDETVCKGWSDAIADRMRREAEAFLVMIDKDFNAFDASRDGWRIVWLSDAKNPKYNIKALFNTLLQEVQRGHDLFASLDNCTHPNTGLSNYGGVSKPGAETPEQRTGKRGRPGVFDKEFSVNTTIKDMVNENDVPNYRHGWKTEFVRRLFKRIPSLEDSFKLPSVCDALHKTGVFDEIEEDVRNAQTR